MPQRLRLQFQLPIQSSVTAADDEQSKTTWLTFSSSRVASKYCCLDFILHLQVAGTYILPPYCSIEAKTLFKSCTFGGSTAISSCYDLIPVLSRYLGACHSTYIHTHIRSTYDTINQALPESRSPAPPSLPPSPQHTTPPPPPQTTSPPPHASPPHQDSRPHLHPHTENPHPRRE